MPALPLSRKPLLGIKPEAKARIQAEVDERMARERAEERGLDGVSTTSYHRLGIIRSFCYCTRVENGQRKVRRLYFAISQPYCRFVEFASSQSSPSPMMSQCLFDELGFATKTEIPPSMRA